MRSKEALEKMNDYLTDKFLNTAQLLEKLEYEFSEMQKNSAVTEDRVNRLDVSHGELSEKCKAFKNKVNYSLFGVAAGIGAFVVCSLSSLIFCRKK